MAGYTKLFGSILDSSVWREPPLTRLVWVTLMAMADRDGVVEASIEGIADRARVDLASAESAMACFMDVDTRSKNPANSGRRVERISEGYRLLNYDFYRRKMSAEETRARGADRQRRFRERRSAETRVTAGVTQSNAPSRSVTRVDRSNGSEAEAEAKAEGDPERPPTEPTTEVDPSLWPAHVWQRRFGIAWVAAKANGVGTLGGGVEASKASGDLSDQLTSLPRTERLAAQARAGAMFAEYLGDDSQGLVKARWPWKWFVQRFDGLRLPRSSLKAVEYAKL